MATCPRCGKRLAKRLCPALGRTICQLCCGTLRGREISCPDSCVHLAAHKSYHERRAIEKTASRGGPSRGATATRPRDGRLDWLVLHIEAALHQYFGGHPDCTDAEAAAALEYVLEKTEKEAGRLIIPSSPARAVNEAGELVLRAVDECRYQATAILETGAQTYKKSEKTAALEQVAWSVGSFFKADPSGRAYLDDLDRKFARADARSREKKLITLT